MTLAPTTAAPVVLAPTHAHALALRRAHPGLPLGAQASVRLRGELDVARLRQALERAAARYEILASNPVNGERGSGPRLAWYAGGAERAGIEALAADHWARLAQPDAPAVGCACLSVTAGEHVLVLSMPTESGDAASLGVLLHEIAALYACPTDDQVEVLQQTELASWLTEQVRAPSDDDSPLAWQAPNAQRLPFPTLPFELRHERSDVSRDVLRRRLPTRASPRPASVQAPLVLTAWALALQRLSRLDAFRLGVVLDGRAEAALHSVVSPLARAVPMAVELDDARDCAAQVQRLGLALAAAAMDQLRWDFAPTSASTRHERHATAFPVLFSWRSAPPVGHAGGLDWTVVGWRERVEPTDLGLHAVALDDVLELELEWAPGRFAAADVAALADLCVALLESADDALSGALAGWVPRPASGVVDHDAQPSPGFTPVHVQIAAQARRTPSATAVVCGPEAVNYGELHRRARGLGQRLRGGGVARGDVVALLATRSIEFVCGVLGVLEAGAAWLPIEPDTPDERIADMLAQAGARAVLAPTGAAQRVASVPVVTLGDWTYEAADASTPVDVSPRDLAYVIFTSGSTGRPKGVAIEHGALASYLDGARQASGLDACRHFALVSTVAADLGHTAIFGALASGGCLHVFPAEVAADADAMAASLLERAVDCVKIVPAHLEALLAGFGDELQLPWRVVVAGGEALGWELVSRVQRVAPGCRVINEYGPTETTVGVVCSVADRAAEPYRSTSVPMGRAMRGSRAYVLDAALLPAGPWLPGELYVAGASVGRGYVGRGDLTAERFLPDPLAPTPGARMYRTGDWARRRGDGALEYLGRRDGQVKVRGYRVELGEIEATLLAHPGVRQVAVATLDGPGGARQLAAWVAVGPQGPSVDELRGFLERRLPAFMLPQALTCLERLPLTANGKVDRSALPAPVGPERRAPVEPADEVEARLLAIWRGVLGLEDVGVLDNYFALGGDSMHVIQLVHEARRAGLALAARDVLRRQTVRGLREALRERQRDELFPDGLPRPRALAPALLSALPADVEDAYPMTALQRFMVAEHVRGPSARGIYHCQESIWFEDEAFSLPALEAAVRAVFARHAALRTVFDLDSQPPLQWVRRGLRLDLHVEDISRLTPDAQDAHVLRALRADRARPFDVRDRDAPLLRAAVFLRSARGCDLALAAHHAVIDGWGHRLLTNQIWRAYTDAKAGRTPELGAPDDAQRQFAAYQEAVRVAPAAARFWRDYLDDVAEPVWPAPEAPEVECDEPLVLRRLGMPLVTALRAAARASALSLQALALSAWVSTLREWSGQACVATGVVTNGRSEHVDGALSGVGLFWNIAPLVSRRDAAPFDLAAQVQRDLIERQPYGAYPWPQILEDRGGRGLGGAVFRYLHFRNVEALPAGAGPEIKDVVAYDRYSFPLDCALLLHGRDADGHVMFQYDPVALGAAQALALVERYVAALHRFAPQGSAL